jgi:hypothetical protein
MSITVVEKTVGKIVWEIRSNYSESVQFEMLIRCLMEMSSRWKDLLSLELKKMSGLENIDLGVIDRETGVKAIGLAKISYKVSVFKEQKKFKQFLELEIKRSQKTAKKAMKDVEGKLRQCVYKPRIQCLTETTERSRKRKTRNHLEDLEIQSSLVIFRRMASVQL